MKKRTFIFRSLFKPSSFYLLVARYKIFLTERRIVYKKIVAVVMAVIIVILVSNTSVSASDMGEITDIVGFVDIEGSVTKEEYLAMVSYYCQIPLNIREEYQLAGWRILLTDKELEKTYFPEFSYMTICGMFDSGAKVIYLENQSNGIKAIVHEIGHFIDIGYSQPFQYSDTDEWQLIWNQEVANNRMQSNSYEEFADAFSDYILNPEKLKKDSLVAYEYVKRIVDAWVDLEKS